MTDGGTGLATLRRFTWWSLTGTTAAFLVLVVGAWLLDAGVPAWARSTGAIGLVMTAVACVVLLSHRLALVAAERPPVGWMVAGGAGAAGLAGILLATRDDELWSLAPAMVVSIIATFPPPRRGWLLVAGAMAVAAAVGGIDGGGPRAVLFPPGLVAFCAWVLLGGLWAWDVAERLNTARRLAAELAVAEERLRFAADLHDIQGHHLQVIARKSELAERLVAADPARAAGEMAEVRRLATDALRDTRAVVQGYRRTTLEEEIGNATRVLAAADVEVRADVEPAADLPEAGRHLLGLVVREATTNVLRHSRARTAEVEYRRTGGVARLRVCNDGAVEPPPGAGSGTGLRGLAERLRVAGGELTWERDRERFVVAASLPVDTT